MEQPSEHPDPGRGLGLTDVGHELERMLRDGELERIARALERDVGISAEDADDAVFTAVKATLAAKKPPKAEKVGSYVYTASKREAVRLSQAASRQVSLESAESVPDTTDFVEKIVSEDIYAQIRARILAWDNANIRAVALAYLDAAYEGEIIDDSLELAAAASEIAGRLLSPGSVRVWKQRAIRQLQIDFFLTTPDEENT